MRSVSDALARGMAQLQEGKLAEAEQSFRKVLRRERRHFGALNLLAAVLIQLRRYEEAEPFLRAALAIDPNSEPTLYNCGVTLIELKRPAEAVQSFDRALAIAPDNAQTLRNRGAALRALRRLEAALHDFDRALSLEPNDAEAHSNKAGVLYDLGRFEEAIAACDAALSCNPRRPQAWSGRAAALEALGRWQEALSAYDTALRLDHRIPAVWFARGRLLFSKAAKYAAAADSFAKVLELDSDYELARGYLLHARMQLFDWRNYHDDVARLSHAIARGRIASDPFVFLTVSNSPEQQLELAKLLARKAPLVAPLPSRGRQGASRRLRIGYLSYDLRDHATSHLAAGLFEHHDKARFETIAFSLAPDDGSDMRRRLVQAFDRFEDVNALDARQVAGRVRELEVDVAVDLMGFTAGNLADIYRYRPAPIQACFLGYPGTTGLDCIDYLIADSIVVPEKQQHNYTEKVVSLPHAYQPNDQKRERPETPGPRSAFGLPDTAFVYCCFNANYKLTPDVFDGWMRILAKVEHGVLWVLQHDEEGRHNLRRAAESRGVSGGRLFFAPRAPLTEYLGRFRLADLFLDTLPYNAHTTASEALWMGLPLLTRIGNTFAGRVAASVLTAAGLPELITHSAEEYEARAIELARESALLSAIRNKIEQNRATCPLFDTARFTRHIEAAYLEMWQRHLRGEPPESFSVPPVG
jgi:predicted O-linked N-acetylglucosamine transferase (SPINDLY family)